MIFFNQSLLRFASRLLMVHRVVAVVFVLVDVIVVLVIEVVVCLLLLFRR